jgi:hypothetical protein
MRVGFYDPGSASVVSLALDSATAWSVPVQGGNGISPRVSISKDGSRMLMALDETLYAIYEADGTPLGSFPLAETGEQPVWQPDGSLAFGNCVHSIEGARACLTLSPELLWQLTVVLTPGADEAVINFEPQPSDRLFRLITFIPGRMTVVGQSYFAGNQAMMQGAQLFTYDLISAERRDLDLMMALGWRAAFTWSPVEAANLPLTLALGDTTGWSADQPALALYNEDSGAINHPLPEGVSVGHMDWNPVSGNLAVSAVLQGEAVSPFNDPGIYSLDPASGVATSLTHPPAGARDGLPRFTKDGKTLLFTRWFESGALEVRSIRVDGSDEALILSGLNAECPLDGPACEWQRWIDYQPY